MRAAAAEHQKYHTIPSPLAHSVEVGRRTIFFLFRREENLTFSKGCGSTDKRGMGHFSPIIVAIRKDEAISLPRMGGTDANIIRITGGNFPTRRGVNRLITISNKPAIVNFVRVKSHINVGAIALQEGGGGGGAGISSIFLFKISKQND
jgi:hypothetical protein